MAVMSAYPIRTLHPSDFPGALFEVPDSPKQLFVRGSLPDTNYQYVCVVGSRATSAYGARMCNTLISGLSGYPVCIVSGLALGTDANAHAAALDAGLPTVAVLPSSIDDESIYPRTNYALAMRVLRNGGALLSEYEPPTKPAKYSFPARNRIMAGISRATLIIEASERSGTLITARLALDYSRDVLAVPHDIGRVQGGGANYLIREGAQLVRDSNDILLTLGLAATATQRTLPEDLTNTELHILQELVEPLMHDELVERTNVPAPELSIAISALQIRGLIRERLGKIERA